MSKLEKSAEYNQYFNDSRYSLRIDEYDDGAVFYTITHSPDPMLFTSVRIPYEAMMKIVKLVGESEKY